MNHRGPWLRVGKVVCIVLYTAAVFLAIHAVELPFFWRRVKAYRGPLAASVVMTLLFGLLHLAPLRGAAVDKG